jgi:RNA polymerase sigma-70 factor, ECF subfamily
MADEMAQRHLMVELPTPDQDVSLELQGSGEPEPAAAPGNAQMRLQKMVEDNFGLLWRFLRRLGLAENDVDDAVQDVLIVAAQRLAAIDPRRERSFLIGTAVRVAAASRRRFARRREVDEQALGALADPSPSPDSMIELKRARELLDAALEDMNTELRAVFVLYELEELTMAEIAALLELRPGTVASRLRRAREIFERHTRRAAVLAQKGRIA